MTGIKTTSGQVIPIVAPTPYDVGDVNMFLIADGNTLTLLDAGDDSDICWEALLLTLRQHGLALGDLSQIWITHSHQDHIGLVNRIVSQVQVPVYAHKDAIPRMKRDPDFIQMRLRFFDRLYREMGCGTAGERDIERLQRAAKKNEAYTTQTDIIPLTEGSRIGDYKVLEVPGHAPDHIVFWNENEKTLFAGDHLIKHISSNAFVEPDFEGARLRTLVQYVESLTKCSKIDADTVFPGHGELIDDHQQLIAMRLKRIGQKADKIREMIISGASTAYQLAQLYYPHKYRTVFSPVMSEIIGLLDFLEAQGSIQKVKKNEVWHYEA
ncbi:MBL fold metallo-hydrolase [Paenibacillus sp. MZ04-78.2]|uniref:MBL fold metallo-hydrolase n=1 Tax=Paenibacillus sp. MZ04-78.2 TaxID=2962034 RepID=UPI0020B7B762|nr:MBL fold metallo-hydrolase [Paenibacillus sp. MZ04-78.2]MCP3772748.1 MBL fold metallo-hydrolase [Paenibacillus sp. MZ04-78.2]